MGQDNKQCIYSAGLMFNIKTGEVSNQKQKLRLSPVNLRVLNVLLRDAQNAISRQQLFDSVWPNQVISDDALTRCISDLRSQLKGMTTSDPLIETIPKVGYRWLPDLESEKSTTKDEKKTFLSQNLKPMLMAVVVLAILLWALLGWLNFGLKASATPIVILPTEYSQSINSLNNQTDVAVYLKDAATNQDGIQYLSEFALESYSGNPFPYYSHQFGVRWFIESQVLKTADQNMLTLNLIDAKTALVIYSQKHRFKKTNELKALCQGFVSFVAEL